MIHMPLPMHPNAADAFVRQMENSGSYWKVELNGRAISCRQWADEEKARWCKAMMEYDLEQFMEPMV